MLEFFINLLAWVVVLSLLFSVISIVLWIIFRKDNNKNKRFKISLSIFAILTIISATGLSKLQDSSDKQVHEAAQNKKNHLKMINEDDTDLDDSFNDNGYKLDSDSKGKATYKFSSNNGSYLKILKGKNAKVENISKTRMNINMYVEPNKDNEEVVVGAFNKNGKMFKKLYLEISNQSSSYLKAQAAKDKAKKEAKEAKMNSEYPEFSSQYPDDLGEYTSEQLTNKQVRFTGKIYGLSADSMGDYMVMLKNDAGQLMYISYDHKDSGKVVLNQKITVYGATNGLSHVRNQDVDNLGVPSGDLGKPMLLMSADKVTKE